MLGSPVVLCGGDDAFLKQFWGAKAAETRTLLRKISAIGHAQHEHTLLRSTADVCRINHLLRSTDTSAVLPILQTIHDDLLPAAETMVGRSLTPEQSVQVFLPTRMAGSGFKSPLNNRTAARMSCIVSYSKDFLTGENRIPASLQEVKPPDWTATLADLRGVGGPQYNHCRIGRATH